jgi:Helix-turn-helix domain
MGDGEPAPRAGTTAHFQDSPKGKRSSRKRFQSINAFLDVTLAGLDRAELAVWLLLWRDTKPDGLARTSQADLARRAGCNPRTVRRALVSLERYGLVCVVRRGGLRTGLSIYRVNPLGEGGRAG